MTPSVSASHTTQRAEQSFGLFRLTTTCADAPLRQADWALPSRRSSRRRRLERLTSGVAGTLPAAIHALRAHADALRAAASAVRVGRSSARLAGRRAHARDHRVRSDHSSSPANGRSIRASRSPIARMSTSRSRRRGASTTRWRPRCSTTRSPAPPAFRRCARRSRARNAAGGGLLAVAGGSV